MAVQPPVNALKHLDSVTSNYVQTQVFWPKNYPAPPPPALSEIGLLQSFGKKKQFLMTFQ